jgi:hypothetical protein
VATPRLCLRKSGPFDAVIFQRNLSSLLVLPRTVQYRSIHVSNQLKMDEDELSTEMLIHRLGEERQRSTEIHLNSESPRTTPEKPVHDTPLVGSQIPTPQTQTPPQDQVQVANGQRSLRKKKSNGHHGNALDPVEEVMKPLTDEERRNWKGWVELESDPVCIHKHISNLPFCSLLMTDSCLPIGSIQLHPKKVRCQGCKDTRNIQTR